MKAIILIALLVLVSSTEFAYKEYSQPIIDKVNSNPKSTWKAGHNSHFDGMDFDAILILMGTLETPQWAKLPETDLVALEALPDNFDSRTNWPNCESIQEVRDQSNCGSCWAFGAVEAMSDRVCIASGQKDQSRISAEDLLSCCGFLCGQGCNGGYPASAWSYFKRTGIVTGDLYGNTAWCRPYTLQPCDHHTTGQYQPCSGDSPTPACKKQCTSESGKQYSDDKHKGKSSYSVSGVTKIQTEIQTYGPVEGSFTVYEDFLTYKSGVYAHTTGQALGGHAIKVLGWGVEDSTPYWLCANSWNEDWGDSGFFKIKRGTNECGIESGIVAGQI